MKSYFASFYFRSVLVGAALWLNSYAADEVITGNLTVDGDVDIEGDVMSLGTRSDSSVTPGFTLLYADSTVPSIYLSATRGAANWLWQDENGKIQMKLGADNKLYLLDQEAVEAAQIVLNPAGESIVGQLAIVDATASVSTVTGALKVAGGLGVAGSVYADSFFGNGSNLSGVGPRAFNPATDAPDYAGQLLINDSSLFVATGTSIGNYQDIGAAHLSSRYGGSFAYDGYGNWWTPEIINAAQFHGDGQFLSGVITYWGDLPGIGVGWYNPESKIYPIYISFTPSYSEFFLKLEVSELTSNREITLPDRDGVILVDSDSSDISEPSKLVRSDIDGKIDVSYLPVSLRVAPSGDLSMGSFTAGTNPAAP